MASRRRARNRRPVALDARAAALARRAARVLAIVVNARPEPPASSPRRWCGCLAIDCDFCLERAARPWAEVTGGAR